MTRTIAWRHAPYRWGGFSTGLFRAARANPRQRLVPTSLRARATQRTTQLNLIQGKQASYVLAAPTLGPQTLAPEKSSRKPAPPYRNINAPSSDVNTNGISIGSLEGGVAIRYIVVRQLMAIALAALVAAVREDRWI